MGCPTETTSLNCTGHKYLHYYFRLVKARKQEILKNADDRQTILAVQM